VAESAGDKNEILWATIFFILRNISTDRLSTHLSTILKSTAVVMM
jgi:predicted protein tyrosine phosphatase